MHASIPKLDFVRIKHDENEEENNLTVSSNHATDFLVCYGIACICFLAFVNVTYVTRCNGIKSEIMVVYILGYDVISIRVFQY